jgi:hypothetical protein
VNAGNPKTSVMSASVNNSTNNGKRFKMANIVIRKESDEGVIEFRYNGSLTINIFIGSLYEPLESFREFDIITFMDEPTLQQVIDTVDEKIVEYAHELTDSDLDALFEKEAS